MLASGVVDDRKLLSVRLPELLISELKAVAASERKSMQEIVEGLVTAYVRSKAGA